ncbi:hypothetical protein BW13_10450 [Bifidobacterium sp. UTCIF-37]|uniref:Lipoprotein n=2 Tax=Bifidobacterium callitrichos TaxID=762209 RepID=A0A2T3GBB5_9BIFI|nr:MULTISPECIES: hypothetical protein [Bifidobacterium]KAA8815578.1 hypothetical protein EMB92_10495 [Bifidobacterium callitrichos]KFI55953.1 putative lipoprotein [Bifidobacterium callitrichos DSM 23973]PST46762.1 hypothetical protein CPA40_03615 [Bifidobacterium callitrichos]TPF85497.1 hypothetical protein BW13_10450 [Bifidobacterium sp. UTCIF-37]TPF87580.1 hypothetical protein BW11_10725 [Bifidobacterium sp. UTCIF-38]
MGAMHNRIGHRAFAAALAMVLPMALCACGQQSSPDAQQQFSGPYASDFRHNYETTSSELAKGILRDGKITDAEFEEFIDRYTSCMSSQGVNWSYTDNGEELRGASGDMSQEALTKATDACHAQTGYMELVPLYQSLQSNPDNLSRNELMKLSLACLQKHGLADQGLTVQEYETIYDDNDRYMDMFGKYMEQSSPDYRHFLACSQDPVNAQ